ncbi:uncharacterized protein LOC127252087 isoform X2 [Andrographis paniculata]|uniref:uncharacterized protein LOC127252087 isoform X2 n=1 Tax=Andrographis paniculata TaxID=175694 RepID=UPI0021E7AA70|nr:uncharacterized protein LOC127252087 isoform X2 [Andrographis paniculata]
MEAGVAAVGGDSTTKKFRHHHQQSWPPQPQISQIGTVNQLLAGGIAGAFSKTCTAPLARLTILFQILKSIPVIHGLGENRHGDSFVHFVGGGLAGITAASATYPLDLVRTRLAAQRSAIYYQGIRHALHTICRDEGFLGLYKGLGATLLGVGPSIAISFSVYEGLKSYWYSQRPNDSTVVVSLGCGSVSGIASSTATFPLDLVRRRMQLEGAAGRARVYKTGLLGTFKHIIHTEGLHGLYRGILPEYCKVVPSVGIIFMTYETLKKLLSHGPFV